MPLTVPIAGQDYELKLPKGHLSFSQMDCYMKCPQQYKRKYVDPQPEKRAYGVALAEGTAMTQTLEAIGLSILANGDKKKKKVLDVAGAKEKFKQVFEREAERVTHWNGENPHLTLERGLSILDRYYDTEQTPSVKDMHPVTLERNGQQVPGTEFEWRIELAGVPVVGITDVVERNYVIDYKYVKGTRYLSEDKSLQLTLNAVALGIPKVAFLAFCKEPRKIEWLPSTRDLTAAKAYCEAVVGHIARSISLGAFHPCDPQQNPLCSSRWCEYHADCFGPFGIH